jgi:hypothetical protein
MKPKNLMIGVLVIALIAFLSVGAISQFQKDQAQEIESTPPITSEAQSGVSESGSEMMADSMDAYENGEYMAKGSYRSPAGAEEVDIKITLENGVVTQADFTGLATNSTSQRLQRLFDEGFEAEVVGKPIDNVMLTVVNGSSLTPKGFMDALEKIKDDARKS